MEEIHRRLTGFVAESRIGEIQVPWNRNVMVLPEGRKWFKGRGTALATITRTGRIRLRKRPNRVQITRHALIEVGRPDLAIMIDWNKVGHPKVIGLSELNHEDRDLVYLAMWLGHQRDPKGAPLVCPKEGPLDWKEFERTGCLSKCRECVLDNTCFEEAVWINQ